MNKICVCGNSMSHSASRCKACDIAWRKIRYLGKNNPFFGKKHSDETKSKISVSHKGYKHTSESRKKMSIVRRGKKFSKEHNKKISDFHKGKILSEETRKKISISRKTRQIPCWNKGLKLGSYEQVFGQERAKQIKDKLSKSLSKENNPFFGKKHSDETKHTISLANSGKKASEETRKKLSVIMKGNKFSLGKYHSIETRLKMSVAKKGVRFTDEHRKNMSGSSCGAWLGGKSFEPYTLDFTTRFKESIKKRDGSSCQLCNKTINELQKSNKYLVIHHINYDKLLSVKENCVSLCGRCHSITNHNREKWIIFFQSMLRDKYGYDYEHQKIVLTLNSDFR